MTTSYRPTTTYTPTQTRYTSSTPLAPMRPRLVAEIYRDPNFQGPKGIVIDNIRFAADIGFQDNISSVRIYRGPGYATSPNHKMILHEHRDFKGRQLVLGPGYYPNLHDIAYNFGDIISSISFGPSLVTTGPDFGTIPLIVEVYQHVNFQGKKITVLRDISHTNQIGLHDAISSIRIFRGPNFPPSGCKAIFYEHIEFDGQALEIPLGPLEYHKELPNLHLHGQFFGDIISSIKLESWVAGGGGNFREVVFKEYGGILVWKNDWRFVRLDKTSSLHAFRGDIRFETHVQKRYQAIGRGRQNSVMNFLRLERTSHRFQAYCSVDGQNWQSCGTSTVVMRDPVMVGMHALCPGNIPPTITRFDYFKIIRPAATTALGLSQ